MLSEEVCALFSWVEAASQAHSESQNDIPAKIDGHLFLEHVFVFDALKNDEKMKAYCNDNL